MAVRAEPAAAATGPEAAAAATPGDGARWLLPAGAVLLVAVLGLYVADLATPPPKGEGPGRLPLDVERLGGRRLGEVGRIPVESRLEGGDPSLERIDQAEDGRLCIGRYFDPKVVGQGRLGAHAI